MTACTVRSHRLAHPTILRELAASPPAPRWPSYTGASQFVGTSADGRTNVFVDPSLGGAGLANAQALVADAARVNAANDGFFGVPGGSTNVIVFALGGQTDGTGGADHMGCDFVSGPNIECCAAFGQNARVSALYEAELSECSMNGNLCGESTGEALSRWCAAVTSGNALGDFATAPAWAQAGFPNWVDRTENTDGDAISTGCGMAFISWVMSHKITLAQIAQAMVALGDAGTLAGMYNRLTGATGSPWQTFLAACKAVPGGITTDDPFAGVTPPPPPPPPPPTGNIGTVTVTTPLPKGSYTVIGGTVLSVPNGLAVGLYDVGIPTPPPPPPPPGGNVLFTFHLARPHRAGQPLQIRGVPAMPAGTYAVSATKAMAVLVAETTD